MRISQIARKSFLPSFQRRVCLGYNGEMDCSRRCCKLVRAGNIDVGRVGCLSLRFWNPRAENKIHRFCA